MSATFRSLGVPNYRLWFAGATVSNVGTWAQRTAQDWMVLAELTKHDAAAVGVTMALQFGPQLVMVPVTGLIADRVDRRRMLMATQAAMGLLALGLGLVTVLGVVQLWMVWGFALALGVVAAVDAPVRQSFVGNVVGEEHLSNAVALNSASFNGARLVGPALAGVLIAAVGSGWVFLLNAASFAAVLVSMFFIRPDRLFDRARPPAKRGQIREGFRYVRSRPDIVVILVMIFLIGAFGLNFPIFTSTMATVAFHAGSAEFGALSSIMAVGSVAGALIAARREVPRIRYIVLASTAFGLTTVLAALTPNYWSFAAFSVLIGLSSITLMTSANGYVQTSTSPAMRGRVMALYMAIFLGGTPIGAPIIGWVANALGPRSALVIGGSSGFVAAAIALAWFARRRIPAPHDTDAALDPPLDPPLLRVVKDSRARHAATRRDFLHNARNLLHNAEGTTRRGADAGGAGGAEGRLRPLG